MPSVDYVQGAFLKLSVNSDLSFELKQEQKIAVNCLLEGRDVFAAMPTGFGKSFISEGLHPNSVIFVICPLISLIEDQIKEGQFWGRTEDKHVRTNSGI